MHDDDRRYLARTALSGALAGVAAGAFMLCGVFLVADRIGVAACAGTVGFVAMLGAVTVYPGWDAP